MASGPVNRIKRPNTWLHRPMLQNVKKALANSEPSTHVNRIKRPNTWLHRPMLQNVKKALANSEPSTHGTQDGALSHSGPDRGQAGHLGGGGLAQAPAISFGLSDSHEQTPAGMAPMRPSAKICLLDPRAQARTSTDNP
jgi:hypothetical protein